LSTELHRLVVVVPLLLLLLLGPVAAVRAEESFAAYPPLPTGYSSIKVYDRHGRFAGRLLPEGRHWVSLERIPTFLQSAVVAIEDARFYEHSGVDLRGIARALVRNVAQGKLAEGGSTITQQLVKNKYLSAEKTIDRKVQEGLLAMEYEKKYSKRQILEMYFNEIYFGNGAWGIAQAARLYYDKSPEELSDAECAVLAGVPKNPARYNPLGKPADVEQRRNTVLKRMAELSMITPRREEQLRALPLLPTRPGPAPQYLTHIRRKLVEWYGPRILERGGLSVVAAMDLDLQQLAEKTLREGVQRVSPELQGALLCLDPHSGDVLAFAGSVDFAQSSYNRAFFAQRQPGSTIKPLIYAAALEAGVTASSHWDDEPVTYPRGNGQSWTPRNYAGESYGTMTLREALARSNNVITVKLLDTIGVPYFLDVATRLGLTLRTPNDLSLALGTDEVTLLDLALAYSPLATGGLRPTSRTILSTQDLYRNSTMSVPPAITPVLSPDTAYITTRMLQDVLAYGTAKSLQKFAAERPAAGKTGTTDDYRDAWFIGYTPQLLTGVWLGHDQPKPGGRGFTGGVVAAPIWERFMRAALATQPVLDFPQPDTVVAAHIDPATGQLAALGCPEPRVEFYGDGTQPTTVCSVHGGQPATVSPEEPPESAAGAQPPPLPPAETVP
jgi:1A family penicillin-binding protein